MAKEAAHGRDVGHDGRQFGALEGAVEGGGEIGHRVGSVDVRHAGCLGYLVRLSPTGTMSSNTSMPPRSAI